MCQYCYNSFGKSKLATLCPHKNKPHYSNGKCQNCYLASYYVKRKAKLASKQKLQGKHAEDTETEQEHSDKDSKDESFTIKANKRKRLS